MASGKRSVGKTSSLSSLKAPSAIPTACVSPKRLPASSPQQRAGETNIFAQMDEFSKKDSPAGRESNADGLNAVCASPVRLRSSRSSSTLSESLISSLHSVLSLPSSIRQSALTPTKTSTVNCQSSATPLETDDNKNCISNDDSSTMSEVIPMKKVKLDDESCEDSVEYIRQQYSFDRLKDMRILTVAYDEFLTELFFLQNGGNLMDYFSWKKRPNTLLACYLCSEKLESDGEMMAALQAVPLPPNSDDEAEDAEAGGNGLDSQSATTCHQTSTPTVASTWLKSNANETMVTPSGRVMKSSSPSMSLFASPIATSGSKTDPSIQQGSSADSGHVKHESIAELARQERKVMEKITELRKKGLWSVRRLPKAPEPSHAKAHWDYVIEEMQWLANDFAQERKWKKAGARKVSRMVARHFMDMQQKELKAEREDALKIRRVASSLAKMVKEFWTNIEKVVQYKQQSRLDEKRKKALDMHLSFIVDQTEKYSTWLTEGLTTATATAPVPAIPQTAEMQGSANSVSNDPPSPAAVSADPEDDQDFKPSPDDSDEDDEETIEKDEQEHGNTGIDEELAALQRESEMPLEEFLQTLPPEAFEEQVTSKDLSAQISTDSQSADKCDDEDASDSESSTSGTKEEEEEEDDDGGSYEPSGDESSEDDEETLAEQERHEKRSVDHAAEIAALQEEENLPIEELLKRYAGECDIKPVSVENSIDMEVLKKKVEVKDEDPEELGTEHLLKLQLKNDRVRPLKDKNNDPSVDEGITEIGTEFLLKSGEIVPSTEELSVSLRSTRRSKSLNRNTSSVSLDENLQSEEPSSNRQITDIAADAMSLQPTGYTLETAHVKTSVPFLIKHSLREYQHVGLDWLATMYEHRLNGILADEMGLGKTIQTIALLAYLACDKGIWGPHLIVVPTSVMLNWEMELKKWCPALKILTYYGSLKERKMKRTGWTKTNAFHVCITSYKLVIQDHQAFRRKKWKYFILDEAQNIKNFKSQRWQTLLNFHSQRRLLLTGTPLQNNLMELWSLMHFLMPHVFQSHREFKEWFSNPLTGMIEGSREYNEGIVRRLHKVLRPFLLRRLKQDVEKQMPKKYEHVVMCRLSKRQRFLYDDFMSQAKTKETLATGHYMSVINILMQLRKVCNHPDLFDPRPTISPFHMEGIVYVIASLALRALETNPLSTVELSSLQPSFCDLEISLTSYSAKRIKSLAVRRPLIVEIDGDTSANCGLSCEAEFEEQTELMSEVSTRFFNKDGGRSGKVCQAINQADSCGLAMSCSSSFANFGTLVETDQGQFEMPDVVDDVELLQPSASVECDSFSASLRCDSLVAKRRVARAEKLRQLYRHNVRRCSWSPIYGADCRSAVDCLQYSSAASQGIEPDWSRSSGYRECLDVQTGRARYSDYELFWRQSYALRNTVRTPEEHLERLKDMLDRFVFNTPPVTAPRVTMHASHPSPSSLNRQRHFEFVVQHELVRPVRCLHSLTMSTAVQFPERRLIQYDCGKLQTLDVLLRQLKVGYHRALIFTQMTKMLDVLESFLNFHGHRYLRLDGTTKVEQRQLLMERFNADSRIFCFILSTRSGGIGVNLTGADTVIFYDSDWNPTMDAQAQDRCHRIGQTRDVHIYRLISEKTIEENILKKANEKRLLGNVAIEGGNFTTAFFRQQTIKDLFEEPTGLESLTKDDAKIETKDDQASKLETVGVANGAGETVINDDMMEQALTAAEDESDIQAAKVARAEAKADLAEFDENIPWDEREMNAKRERDEESKVEVELAQLDNELTPIERYAVSFVELLHAPLTQDELQKAEEEVTLAKEEWEITHLKAIKEQEERLAEIEEDEMLYTNTQGSPRLKYLTSHSNTAKSKGTSNKAKAVLSLYDYSAVDWESSSLSSPSEDENVSATFNNEETIVDDELEISTTSHPVSNLSFRSGRRNQYGCSSNDLSQNSVPSTGKKRGRKKKQIVEEEPESDFEPPVKKKPGRKSKLQLSRIDSKLRKSEVIETSLTNIGHESDVDQEIEMSCDTVEDSPPRADVEVNPRTSWFQSYQIPRFSVVSSSPQMIRSEVVRQQLRVRPGVSFVRLNSEGNFIVTSAPTTASAAVSFSNFRPPTPILEKLGAVVSSEQVVSVRNSAPVGMQVGFRGAQPRQLVVAGNTHLASLAGNPARFRYALASASRPQQSTPVSSTAILIGNSMGSGSQQTANIVYQAAGSLSGVLPRQVQLQVPTNSVHPQVSQGMFLIPQHSVSSTSQKQSFMLAPSSAAAPTRAATSEKSSYVLLPTSNRQSFILAPTASVSSAVGQVQQLSLTSTGLVLPSGLTMRQQPLVTSAVRPTTLLAQQNSVVRAVVGSPSANPLPILEKFALQLNTVGSSSARFELVSGTSPTKQIVPGVATMIQQPVAGSPAASPVKVIPGGAGAFAAVQQIGQSQQFITLPGAGGLRTLSPGSGTGTIRLVNRAPVSGVVRQGGQTFNLAQLIIRQPNSLTVQRPVQNTPVGFAVNTVQSAGAAANSSPMSQMSTVIIVESRPAADQNSAK